MLFKNRQKVEIRWKMGEGPGRFTLFAARPGEFVEIPDGVLKAAKRAGFTPVTELPPDEQPNIRIRPARHGVVPEALLEPERRKELRNRRNGGEAWDGELADDLSDGNPSVPMAMRLENVPELAAPPAPTVPYPGTSAPTPPEAPPEPAAPPSDPMAESIAAAGNVELPPAPPEVVADAAASGAPAPPVQRDTKPEKPSAKGKAK